MSSFEETSRPVVFECEDSSYQYWGNGSSLLIANPTHVYWATASHVMKNMGGSAESLRIFPSDYSRVSLPFNEQYTITQNEVDDPEHQDVVILRIDLEEFKESGDQPLVSQDLVQGLLSAGTLNSGDVLWVIGYPAESNMIDYDREAISSTRSVVRALYKGESVSDHCHTLQVDTTLNLESFDGLSGSPVFYFREEKINGEVVCFPLLVGMLLRGTASSGLCHFVCSSVLATIVRTAEEDDAA